MHFSVNISGKKVGLLGGSFNPAHEGHLAIAQKALEMGLDYVIWLVVPQNPLKPPYEMSLEERVKSAEGVCRLALNCHPGLDPGSSVLTNNAILKELGPHFRGDDEECRDDNVDRIIISSLEEEIHSANTYDTLTYLTKHFPDTKFVWLMGVDCLDQFHLWENYDKFTNLVDIIIFNRPGLQLKLVKNINLVYVSLRKNYLAYLQLRLEKE